MGGELPRELSQTAVGILVLTRENLETPWLNFEAGALAGHEAIDSSRVIPYLVDMGPGDLPVGGPLSQFQAVEATKAGTFDLVKSLNSALDGSALKEATLEMSFETFWPKLEEALGDLPDTETDDEVVKTVEDKIDEIHLMVRQMRHQSEEDGPGLLGSIAFSENQKAERSAAT